MELRSNDTFALLRRLHDAEERSADLATLYATAHELHRTLDRTMVIGAIREVLTGLLGCEHFGIFERLPDKNFRLIASEGIDPHTYQILSSVFHPLGHLLARGKRWVIGDADLAEDEDIVAAIPLTVSDDVIGGIVIFELLPQKDSLSRNDLELFDLLQTHGGTALFSTNLYELISGARCS